MARASTRPFKPPLYIDEEDGSFGMPSLERTIYKYRGNVEEICRNYKIDSTTFYKYKNKIPAIEIMLEDSRNVKNHSLLESSETVHEENMKLQPTNPMIAQRAAESVWRTLGHLRYDKKDHQDTEGVAKMLSDLMQLMSSEQKKSKDI